MRVYNKYVISLAIVFGLVNTALGLAGQTSLDVYVAVNAIAYLTISLLYVYLNPRARTVLSTMGIVVMGGFLIFVVMRVIEVLGR